MEKSDIIRKLRRLKKEEERIRYSTISAGADRIFDRCFDLKEKGDGGFTPAMLEVMDHETRKGIFEAFLLEVHISWIRENGLSLEALYDPAILKRLGLPFDADEKEIKKRFRKLAKEYHPDAGGSDEAFMSLMALMDELDMK